MAFSTKAESVLSRRRAFILLALLLLASVIFSLVAGSSSHIVLRALQGESKAIGILLHLRIPRTLCALCAGAALAVSGCIIQSVLSNPMASPSLLGVNAGAGFFTVLASVLFPGLFYLQMPAGFFGALLASLLITSLAMKIRASRMSVILAGLAVSQIFSAGMDVLITLFPDALSGYSAFKIGSVTSYSLSRMAPACIGIGIGLLLAFLCGNELEVLSLGSEQAASVGLNVKRWMRLELLIAALLAGCAVALCGLLGFLGLIVPNLVRRFHAGSMAGQIGACMMLGPSLLLVCDTIGRVFFAPGELPAGVLLSLIGAPFFLLVLFQRRRKPA